MKIVIDAMGGDYAPESIVEGAISALDEFDTNIALVGLKDRITHELSKYQFDPNRVEVIDAPDVIAMDEPATVSIRRKKKSSISQGVSLLKDSSCDAFISAGNTGAVVCASTVYLGMLPGVERPGIGLVIPTVEGVSFLIDVGANTECKPKHLMQYAIMSRIYAQHVLNLEEPTIGLLNIGSEESKGSDFIKETHKLLGEGVKGFVGNVEANEIFSGKCGCIIADGFVGNVVIKVAESVMESAGKLLKREIKKSPIALFGAILMKSRLQHIKKHADYAEYGGAPLLGVNGLVLISHGRSNAKAIKNAIRAAVREIEHQIMQKMIEEIR